MLTGGKFIINLFLFHFVLELPWDQPSDEDRRYRYWLAGFYYHGPWNKIDNMIILNLLRRILIHDAAQRAKVTDIQHHKWISTIYPQSSLFKCVHSPLSLS
jgi:hypothetical protein